MLFLLELLALLFLTIGAFFLIKELIRTLVRFWVTLNGPFYAPTSDKRIKQIIKLAELKPGMKVADLGSGDGRILIELVKAEPKITAVGYEIDPKYIKLSRKKIKEAGLEKQIEIRAQNFWQADLSQFDVITVYCVQRFMGRLEKKLKDEIGKKTKVISVFFYFPHWQPKEKLGDIKLYQV